jgi:uncharacterized protein (UPF0335 family)
MDTDERLKRVEQRIADIDQLIEDLIAYARKSPFGRAILKAVHLGP